MMDGDFGFVLLVLLITGLLCVNSVVTFPWLGYYAPYYLFVMCLDLLLISYCLICFWLTLFVVCGSGEYVVW